MRRQISNSLRQMFDRPVQKRVSRLVVRGFDALEARLVLSTATATPPPPTLGGSLAQLGVIPLNPKALPQATAGSKLANDVAKLQADSLQVQAGSSVTVGQITALGGDDQALAGIKVDPKAFAKTQSDILAAVFAHNPAQAQNEFIALYGSPTAQAAKNALNKAYNDEVQIIINSHITPAATQAIAADNAAILADLGGTPPAPPAPPTPPPAGSQLAKDLGKLQADTLAVQANSAATIAEITALQGDDMAIAKTGYKIDGKALIKAQTDLALAVIAGNPNQAQAEFVALFGGKVDIKLVNKAFADTVAIIKDSHVSAAALNTIAADVAAVAKDQGTQAPAPPPPSLGGSLSILGLLPNA